MITFLTESEVTPSLRATCALARLWSCLKKKIKNNPSALFRV